VGPQTETLSLAGMAHTEAIPVMTDEEDAVDWRDLV